MAVCVSQIYITDRPSLELPEQVWQATQSFLVQIPDHKHHLFGAEELRVFIDNTFGSEVVWAFDQLVPYAYKADLARYCLLHELGGWYIDLGMQGNNVTINTDGIAAFFFRDAPNFPTLAWSIANGLMYAQSQHKVFQLCVDMIVAHCHEQYYGATPLCPTGPSLLGRAIARLGADNNMRFGTCSHATDAAQGRRMAFTIPNDITLAYRRAGNPGDLASAGLIHTNNYAHLYATHQIYKGNSG